MILSTRTRLIASFMGVSLLVGCLSLVVGGQLMADGIVLFRTDIRMPESGMKALRDIKRAQPSLPVVIITGCATVSSAVQAMKLGPSDRLEKPFTPDALMAAVRSARSSTAASKPETHALVHSEEVLRVRERAASDGPFVAELFYSYEMTGPEKLAILTGDIGWIEAHIGSLSPQQKRWLEQRLSAEIW
jgi:hypothetical protein